MSTETARQECNHEQCEHREANTEHKGFWGHCSHASCPNYMESCPRHQTPVVRRP